MIGAEWCGVCQQKKLFLQREGIDFEYYDLDSSTGKMFFDMVTFDTIPIFILMDGDKLLMATNSVKELISMKNRIRGR
jgi:glutaredoxin-related protein